MYKKVWASLVHKEVEVHHALILGTSTHKLNVNATNRSINISVWVLPVLHLDLLVIYKHAQEILPSIAVPSGSTRKKGGPCTARRISTMIARMGKVGTNPRIVHCSDFETTRIQIFQSAASGRPRP